MAGVDKLWIGDLPSGISPEQLSACFSQFGPVANVKVLPQRENGAQAGLVFYTSPEEASAALSQITAAGNMVAGLEKQVVVRVAHNKGPNNGGGVGGPCDNVFIGGLPCGFTNEQITTIFTPYGAIVDCKSIPSKLPGGNAAALVRFTAVETAKWVVENLHGNMPEGLESPITVRFANSRGGDRPVGGPGPMGGGQQFAGGCQGGGQQWGGGKGYGNGGCSEWGAGGGKGGWGGDASWGGAGKGGGCGKGSNVGTPGSARLLLQSANTAGLLGPNCKSVGHECSVYIKHLPADMTDLDVHNLFCAFGPIASGGANAILNPDGSCKGIAFVDFLHAEAAQSACAALNGFATSDGTTIFVQPKQPKNQGGPMMHGNSPY